jgi:G3E family GTPase
MAESTAAGGKAQSATAGSSAPARVPVTIVTGALGAGKSTLLSYILSERHGYRVAVIENEFADEMGVESLILKNGLGGPAADGFYELANGCMCCSVRDDLVATVEKLMERRDRFDYILVETSGMANPGPVAAAFWTDDEIESPLCLDAIVTVVDAAHLRRQLQEAAARPDGTSREVEQQLAFADVILLNKTDLVAGGEAELAELEAVIRGMNGAAALHRTTRSVVPLSTILNINAFDTEKLVRAAAQGGETAEVVVAAGGCGPACRDHNSGHVEHAGHDHADHDHADHGDAGDGGPAASGGIQLVISGHHSHDDRIHTVVLRTPHMLDADAFTTWVGRLLWDAPALAAEAGYPDGAAPPLIYRGKGSVAMAGDGGSGPVRYIFQSVYEQFDAQPATGDAAAWAAQEEPSSAIVLIGRNLAAGVLLRHLEAHCRAGAR